MCSSSNLKNNIFYYKAENPVWCSPVKNHVCICKTIQPRNARSTETLAIQAFSGRQVSCRPSRRALGLNLGVSLNLAYHQASIPFLRRNLQWFFQSFNVKSTTFVPLQWLRGGFSFFTSKNSWHKRIRRTQSEQLNTWKANAEHM